MPARLTTPLIYGLVVLGFAMLAACQTAPPVQEMSDARQAIMAARAAGAAEKAADALASAEEQEQMAKDALNQRAYMRAKRHAELAKSMALDALRQSKADQDSD